jgi:hypothetical protein
MSSDKDRLGSKLHEKEKAEEDRYFAAQDRAKLTKIHDQDSVENVPLGFCPRCGVALEKRELHDVSVDDCAKCGGVWLDKGVLERVVAVEGGGEIQHFVRNLLKLK